MAQLTFDIGNNGNRIMAAFSDVFNYQPFIHDPAHPESLTIMIANPETLPNFTRRMIKQWILDVVKDHESVIAAEIAKASKRTEVDNQVVIS